jgi:hypothetical protein
MSKASGFVMFLLGAAAGSVAVWQYLKPKYEQIAQDEIDSVTANHREYRKAVKTLFGEDADEEVRKVAISTQEAAPDDTEEITRDGETVFQYANRVKGLGYTNYSDMGGKQESEPPSEDAPFIIAPEEFGDYGDEYEQISLTYYSDKILADSDDRMLDGKEIESLVGFDSLGSFGQYEDDSVFVRNPRLKTDFEILLDQRTYLEVMKTKPKELT